MRCGSSVLFKLKQKLTGESKERENVKSLGLSIGWLRSSPRLHTTSFHFLMNVFRCLLYARTSYAKHKIKMTKIWLLTLEANGDVCVCVYTICSFLCLWNAFNRGSAFCGASIYLCSSASIPLGTAGPSSKEFFILWLFWASVACFVLFSSIPYSVVFTGFQVSYCSAWPFDFQWSGIPKWFCHLRGGESRAVRKFSAFRRGFDTLGW